MAPPCRLTRVVREEPTGVHHEESFCQEPLGDISPLLVSSVTDSSLLPSCVWRCVTAETVREEETVRRAERQ